mgnify:CR=1 FL=1
MRVISFVKPWKVPRYDLQLIRVIPNYTNDSIADFKDSLGTAEKDLLFELDELFHKTITEFRFQNRLWKIKNIAKSHMDRVRHLSLPLPKRIYELANEPRRIADYIIQHQPEKAVRAIQDHLSVFFSDIERIREEHSEYFIQ